MASQVILKGGMVVSPQAVETKDILIEGSRITAVGHTLEVQAPQAESISVAGLTVFPGLIDAHVHLREPGGEHKEDFHSGTSAALAGGVTTVLAMPNTNPPIVDQGSLNKALSLARSKAVSDFGLFIGGTPDNAIEAAELSDAVGLKLYVGSSTGNLLVDQLPAQIAHFEQYPHDRIIAVHAEDEAAVQYFAARGQRRPPICAALATAHVLTLAEQFNKHIHICHVSTAYELDLIKMARERGLDVTCEVAPHHLYLSTEDEIKLKALGKVNPPLRDPNEIDKVWERLSVVDMIATDHAPHTLNEKASDNPPSGMPGLETMLPLLLKAVSDGRMTLPDIARMAAQRPADVFGLVNKGQIAPGYDADLTLVDLEAHWTVENSHLFTRCGWSPFEGWEMRGQIRQVYLRGQKVFENGRVLASAGYGQQVQTQTSK